MSIQIINGPSKLDLLTILAYCCDDKQQHWVYFTLENTQGEKLKFRVPHRIIGLAIEDGSGESWIIDAYVKNGERKKFWYRTDTRKGHAMANQ